MKIPIYSEKISDFLFFNEPSYFERIGYSSSFSLASEAGVSELLLSTLSGDAFIELTAVSSQGFGAAWYKHDHTANGAIFGCGFVEEVDFDLLQLLSASNSVLSSRIAEELAHIRMRGGWTNFFEGCGVIGGTDGFILFTIMKIIFEEFLQEG